ncbi:MAG: hypothetical protein AB7F75_13145 [Planctomycetota bacterium]
MASKTVCPLTRDEFRADVKPLKLEICGQTVMATPKEFSTGSLGWNITGKVLVEIGGKTVQVQVGANLTVIGSKELPK